MNLKTISFPIYHLGKNKPNITGTKSSYTKIVHEVEETIIIDDKSILADTLAKRRLIMHGKGIKLQKLDKAIYYLGDLIKLSNPNDWFIDSKGNLFKYEKTKFVPLVCKKILTVKPDLFCCQITVEDLNGIYKSLYGPNQFEKYASFLIVEPHVYVFYGYSTTRHKQTVRKI